MIARREPGELLGEGKLLQTDIQKAPKLGASQEHFLAPLQVYRLEGNFLEAIGVGFLGAYHICWGPGQVHSSQQAGVWILRHDCGCGSGLLTPSIQWTSSFT